MVTINEQDAKIAALEAQNAEIKNYLFHCFRITGGIHVPYSSLKRHIFTAVSNDTIFTSRIMITQTTKTMVLACTLITINFAAFGQNLEVASGGLLYLSPGAVVTAGGNFSNAGTVTLDASTTAYSQLKISGTATGDVVQSQYLEAGSHLVSSPVSQGFTTTSGDKTKLYSYDAAAGNWSTIGANFATAGLGFAARVDASQIPFLTAAANASVTGTPNTSMTHTLGYFGSNSLAGGSGTGWNLIGNPYTCGLDWSTVSLTNVNSAFYIWDPATTSYKYYSGAGAAITDPVIPPMQAFWVQATQAGASIATTMATHGTVSSSSCLLQNDTRQPHCHGHQGGGFRHDRPLVGGQHTGNGRWL